MGLVRRSVFFKHIPAGLPVFATPRRSILLLQKSCFSSCLQVFFGPATNKAGEGFFCRPSGLPASSGRQLGAFWWPSGLVCGGSDFLAALILRSHSALAAFKTFSEDVPSEIKVFIIPRSFVESLGGCFFVAYGVKRGWSDDLWSRRAVGLHFFWSWMPSRGLMHPSGSFYERV